MLAFLDRERPAVLESTAPAARGGRYTILACEPSDVVELDAACGGDWLEQLAERIGRGSAVPRTGGLPFVGGWIGFIGYEAGPVLENVRVTQARCAGWPVAAFARYNAVAVFDHAESAWWVAGSDSPAGGDARDGVERVTSVLLNAPPPLPVDWSASLADEFVPAMSREAYFERVAAAQAYIRAGDIYQVNVTQRFSTETSATAADIYRRVRRANPAAYSAFLPCGLASIVSASPELFLELRDGRALTRPIKGTRPRGSDSAGDERLARELLASEKDRAELTMIVDLLRNDLGRVSRFGSVRVESAGELETHPTVFHLVASISGELCDGLCWSDVLRAAYPGGSITGCPKIRAMEVIDELEVTERGPYCGAIGYIGFDGSMCLSVAIRTMVHDGGRLHLYGGGAITSDSDARDEYEEIRAKIAGLEGALRARGGRKRTVSHATPLSG